MHNGAGTNPSEARGLVAVGEPKVVLVVDSDEETSRWLCGVLREAGYDCTTVSSATEALTAVASKRWGLVLSDVMMPGGSGLSLLHDLRGEHPNLPIVMASDATDPQLATVALELGASGYVTKPFDVNQVVVAVANALRRAQLEVENRAYRERLASMVTQGTADRDDALHERELSAAELRRASEDTIQALSQAIEGRDVETGQHIARMARYATILAQRAGLNEDHVELIRLASPMHDVGKISIADGILFKPGPLTVAEFDVIKQHAESGYAILVKSGQPLHWMAAVIAHTHHERWDGTGYPQSLAGETIPLEGRITAIADVFDALVSRRVYKAPIPMDQALGILSDGRGSQFDAGLVDLFLENIDEVVEIREQHPDD